MIFNFDFSDIPKSERASLNLKTKRIVIQPKKQVKEYATFTF